MSRKRFLYLYLQTDKPQSRQSQKQSALTQLAKKGVLTTKPSSAQRALATLSPNTGFINKTIDNKSAGRRRRGNKKTHKKNRKGFLRNNR